MPRKIAMLTLLASVLSTGSAYADLAGPAEAPPAGYKAQQYVDSRGCVFLRAGHGGRTEWVPRISRDRKQLCGPSPSQAAAAVQANTAQAAPPPPAVVAAPVAAPVIAPPVVRAPPPAPVVAAAPAPQRVATMAVPPRGTNLGYVEEPSYSAPIAPQGGYAVGCSADAPYPQSFVTNRGDQVVLCTRGDGSMGNAQFPRLRNGGNAGWGDATGMDSSSVSQPVLPQGYKLAWDDDRLNPHRGPRSEHGQLAQDQMWSRDVPAKLLDSKLKKPPMVAKIAPKSSMIVSQSSKSDPDGQRTTFTEATNTASPTAKAATGSFLVQVGAYGQPANAKGALQRLEAQGLPVLQRAAKGGKLAVVYAGPFASADQARMAMQQVKSAGFKDALIAR